MYQFHNVHPERSVIWIWKTKCIPRIKFFGCLLLVDRLNTKNLLRRRKTVSAGGIPMCHVPGKHGINSGAPLLSLFRCG
jgi:hypothetical protein